MSPLLKELILHKWSRDCDGAHGRKLTLSTFSIIINILGNSGKKREILSDTLPALHGYPVLIVRSV